MTVATSTSFDMATFKRSYEEWDIEALLALYAGEVEVIQIDRDNPPSAPRTRHGKDVLRGMFEHCAGAGVAATVEDTVADGHRAAATVTCEFPAAAGCWRPQSLSSRIVRSAARSRSAALPTRRCRAGNDAAPTRRSSGPSRVLEAEARPARPAGYPDSSKAAM